MTSVRIGADDAGCRLDRWLRRHVSLKKLSEIYLLIRKGGAKVNGRKRKESYRLKEGDTLDIAVPDAEISDGRLAGDDVPATLVDTQYFQRNFTLLFEDENLMVCDKPSGLVVHSGTGHLRHDSLIDLATSYLARSAGGTSPAPFLVHRLDRDTSGVILIAKNRQTLGALHEALRGTAIRKTYTALCHGRPRETQGVVDVGLVREYERRGGTKVRVAGKGLRSRSSYRVAATRKGMSRLEVELETGRTHQIRVHMAHLGCPVVGDTRYGDRKRDERVFADRASRLKRLYLHAQRIGFFYPVLGREVVFESPVPSPFSALWNSL